MHIHASGTTSNFTNTFCVAHRTRSGCARYYVMLTHVARTEEKKTHVYATRVVSCRRSCRSAHPSSNPPLWPTFVESAFPSFPITPYDPCNCSKGEGNHLESHPKRLRAAFIIIILIASRMNYRWYKLVPNNRFFHDITNYLKKHIVLYIYIYQQINK